MQAYQSDGVSIEIPPTSWAPTTTRPPVDAKVVVRLEDRLFERFMELDRRLDTTEPAVLA